MTQSIRRRDLLGRIGATSAARDCLAGASQGARAELAAAFRRSSRDESFDRAARAIAAGATREDVFGAVFQAGIEDIRPQPVGNVLHTVMMIESALVVTEGASARETWLAALWALDDFKTGQQQDERRGDWQLGPAPEAKLTVEAARRELARGLDRFEPDRAERAVLALLGHAGAEACFQALWPYAARSLRDAGHRIIYAAQVDRAVRRLGPGVAGSALRSLVLGLANDADGPHTEAFARSRAFAPRLPDGWLSAREAPERSLDILRALRGRTSQECQDAVLEAYRSGLGPATVWDGLRLYAAELMLLRPARRAVFPVHTLTEMEALGHAFDRAQDEPTRRLLALQAGAWVATVRDAVIRNNGAYAEGPGIDAARQGSAPNLTEAIDARSPGQVATALQGIPGGEEPYLARLRADLVTRADQNHQYKLVGAAIEESRRVNPRWRARVLATAVDYVPAAPEPTTEVHARSLAALKRAGV